MPLMSLAGDSHPEICHSDFPSYECHPLALWGHSNEDPSNFAIQDVDKDQSDRPDSHVLPSPVYVEGHSIGEREYGSSSFSPIPKLRLPAATWRPFSTGTTHRLGNNSTSSKPDHHNYPLVPIDGGHLCKLAKLIIARFITRLKSQAWISTPNG